jgi:putative flippase GtrA
MSGDVSRRLRLSVLFARGGFPRFALVGVLITLVGYAIFCAALGATGHAASAAAASTALGVVFNFRSIGWLVFGSSDLRLVGRFTLLYVLLFSLNVGALQIAQGLGVAPALAQAVLIAPLAGLSFLLNRSFVFDATTREDA